MNQVENRVIHVPTPSNFVYPEIKASDYKFGSGQLAGVPLREDGDWRDYLPPAEEQKRNGVESSACFIEAQQHTIATIQEEQFNLPDQNYSARFNLINSNATPLGGSPLVGADSIRHDGLIPDSMLPFSDGINSWQEFNSFSGGNEVDCVREGQEWLKKWEPEQDIVFERGESVETKYAKIKEAIKYSPLPVSVVAWYLDKKTGLYIKPKGMNDTHLVELVHVDEQNRATIFDTYEPFIKVLEPNFNFDFGMRWSLKQREAIPQDNWFVDLIKNFLKIFKWR